MLSTSRRFLLKLDTLSKCFSSRNVSFCRARWLYISPQRPYTSTNLFSTEILRNSVCYECTRFKYTSNKKKRDKEEPSDQDEEDEFEDWLNTKGSQVKTVTLPSLRMEMVLKSGLGIARNKITQHFYDSKLRLNGKKVLKKGMHVNIGDEVDLIKGFSPANSDFLIVSRVELLKAEADEEEEQGIEVKFRRTKSLTIENYPDGDPWKVSDKITDLG